ncbi:MAG: hypothetical protein AUK47_25360 [Deltaproteobacteria bacterium CG2_30_63_29]|nr:MAG: hypothetical protein AUK47_25360 [Deltaproteobacteria bacterium CG2_30_63_29]
MTIESSGAPPVHGKQKVQRNRLVRFSVALISVTFAFAFSVYYSQGRWQFAWNPQSLLAQPEIEEGSYDLSSIVVLNRVLLQLQENYVDSERFNAKWMLASGLNEIQNSVPEILAVFDRPVAEEPTEVVLHVGNSEKTFTFADVESLWEMSLKFKEIFRFVQQKVDGNIDPHKIEYAAINGLLRTLDPHSVLLDPDVYREMLEGNRGNFGGLGIIIRMIEGKLYVVKPMSLDTPAVVAGVKKGDIIAQIDGNATLNMDVADAVDLLRGEPGTSVKLMIERASEWKGLKEFDVVRAEIQIPSVESAALEDQIGYVRLKGFQGNTYKDMVSHIAKVKAEMGGLKGLILDLRGNPGGLLDQAIDISDEFISDGTIVTTVGSGKRYRKPYPAHEEDTQSDIPIVVLIDPGSASASEIVAGALKNHDRALIVGETSFGKGSVQVLYELPQDGSALKLTIAQYLTPGDISIQSVGIVPDIELVPISAEADEIDLALTKWVRRESTLQSHLDHENTIKNEKPTEILRYLLQDEPQTPVAEAAVAPSPGDTPAPGIEPSPEGTVPVEQGLDPTVEEDLSVAEQLEEELVDEEELSPDKDPQVRMAHDLLVDAGKTIDRKDLLVNLKGSIEKLAKQEDDKLTQKLAGLDVDWTNGPNPETPLIALSLKTDHPDGVYKAGDTVTLEVTLTNNGPDPVHRVYGITESSTDRFEDHEVVFGKLEPGQTITRTKRVKIASAQQSRGDRIALKLYSDAVNASPDTVLGEQNLDLVTEGKPVPHFAFTYDILDSDGDGLASEGEAVRLRFHVTNLGDGVATQPASFLKNLSGPSAFLTDARLTLDALEPAATTDFAFGFNTRASEAETLEFEFNIFDKSLGRTVTEKIKVPYGARKADWTQKSGTAVISKSVARLRLSSADHALVVATADKGQRFKLEGSLGDSVKVSSKAVQGWLSKNEVDIEGDSTQPLDEFDLVYTGSAPMVTLSLPSMSTDADRIKVSGKASDDGELRDLYVFVYNEGNHVRESQKVAYQRLSGQKSDFDVSVPLAEGMNRIKVVTRDDDEMEVSDSVYVYRR